MVIAKPARGWQISAALLMGVSLVCVEAAAQVSGPDASGSAPSQAIAVDAATLKRYAGYYQIGNIQGVMTVAVAGTQLSTQVTGRAPVNLYAQTPTHFFQKAVGATIDFVTHGNAPATALILHEDGRDITMPRMDDALATRFNAEFDARIKANTPRPGAEAAARDFFARISKGQPPDYSKMSPELAAKSRPVEPDLIDGVKSLGALQSLAFQGVDSGGVDIFVAKFLSGSVLLHINMDSKGVITGLDLQRFP
jgi:bla regulator protein BlaR1